MKRFKNILFLLNGDFDESSSAFRRVLSLADSNNADLTILAVLPNLSSHAFEGVMGMTLPEIESRMLDEERKKLEDSLARLSSQCRIIPRVVLGKRYLQAIHLVVQEGYDLLIKVAENPGWLERLFGSEDMHLLRKCPCPLWIMKNNASASFKEILAAVDFDQNHEDFGEDELNQTILELASSLAVSELGNVHVINVYNVPSAGFISLWVNNPEQVDRELQECEYHLKKSAMQTFLETFKKRMGDKAYTFLSPSIQILQGNPAQLIPEIANKQKFDLVVMGSVGRSGIAGLIIGNTAESILSQLDCSVLVLKPGGFVSPVV
jgi:nucleotide-binding universal stress UspA family protein